MKKKLTAAQRRAAIFTQALKVLDPDRYSFTCNIVGYGEGVLITRKDRTADRDSAHQLYVAALRDDWNIPTCFGFNRTGRDERRLFTTRIIALTLARELAREGYTARDFRQ